MSNIFVKKEMILDNKPEDGIMVINVNAQGILEMDRIGRRLVNEFPEIELQYRAACHQGTLGLGQMRFFEVDRYRILLICTAHHIVGSIKDYPEVIEHTTNKIIDAIAEKYKNFKFTSGILNRGIANWASTHKRIKELELNWQIFIE